MHEVWWNGGVRGFLQRNKWPNFFGARRGPLEKTSPRGTSRGWVGSAERMHNQQKKEKKKRDATNSKRKNQDWLAPNPGTRLSIEMRKLSEKRKCGTLKNSRRETQKNKIKKIIVQMASKRRRKGGRGEIVAKRNNGGMGRKQTRWGLNSSGDSKKGRGRRHTGKKDPWRDKKTSKKSQREKKGLKKINREKKTKEKEAFKNYGAVKKIQENFEKKKMFGKKETSRQKILDGTICPPGRKPKRSKMGEKKGGRKTSE